MQSPRRSALWLLCLLAGFAACLSPGGQAVAADAAVKRQPNVVIFLADDMGSADVGVYGCKDIPTPHIDELAESGVRFTNAYTSGCVCSPTRAGLVSGRYQQRFGFDANAEGGPAPTDRAPRALDIHQTTIAQRMQAQGYATALVGKWHLGSGEGYRPIERGFDEFYGFYPYGLGAVSRSGEPVPIYRGLDRVETPENHMESFAAEAISFVERHAERPFFLYMAFPAVHGPYVAPEPWFSRLESVTPVSRRRYAADLAQMDDVIGRVMAALGRKELEEHTLVFFLADNGGSGGPADNGQLRNTKWTLWEGGIRVPFIAQWKGRIAPGRVLAQPVIQLDIGATALAAAGAEIRPEWKLDGANLLPLLEGRTSAAPHAALYWRFGVQYAVRQGNWKLVKPHVNDPPRLFDLSQDQSETDDLANRHPEKVQELQKLWDAWNAENESPRWLDVRWNGDGPQARKRAARGAERRPPAAPSRTP